MSWPKRKMRVIGIIPARIGSTRLSEKPLQKIAGKELILHVCQQAMKSKNLDRLVVATDDERIAQLCEPLIGVETFVSKKEYATGTDRIADTLVELDDTADIVVNIQGDEPFLTPEMIDNLIDKFSVTLSDVGTYIRRITKSEELFNPSIVKVVLQNDYNALYFSRSPIPYCRAAGENSNEWLGNHVYWKHIGIYAYRAEALEKFSRFPETDLEVAESLEQLRLLQSGLKYFCVETNNDLISIDTPEDIERAELKIKGEL